MGKTILKRYTIIFFLLQMVGCSFTPFVADNASPDMAKAVILASSRVDQNRAGKITSLSIKNTNTGETYNLILSAFFMQSSMEIEPGEYVIEALTVKEFPQGWVATKHIAENFNVPFKAEAGKITFLGSYKVSINGTGSGGIAAVTPVGIAVVGGGGEYWEITLDSVNVSKMLVELAEKTFKSSHKNFTDLEIVSPFSSIHKSSKSTVEFYNSDIKIDLNKYMNK